MSELNQKEVNDQMYLFVKRWLDDLPFEECKKVPVMAIGYCLARLSKQDELLKEKEDTLEQMRLDNTDLRNCNTELMKAQEAVQPSFKQDEKSIFVWCCGSCGAYMYHIYDGIDKAKEYAKFCRQCGKPVDWDT